MAEIAREYLAEGMIGICIGSVSAPGTSGRPIVVGIAVTRDGELAITTPGPDGSGQDWTVVG